MRQALLLAVGLGTVALAGCKTSTCMSKTTYAPTIDQCVPRIAPPPVLPPQTAPPPLAPAAIKPINTPRTSAIGRPELST